MSTAADALVERLIAWGVDTIFGMPGDGINGAERMNQSTPSSRSSHGR